MVGPARDHEKSACHAALLAVITLSAADDESDAVVDGMVLIHGDKNGDSRFSQQFLVPFQGIAAKPVSQDNAVHIVTHFFGSFAQCFLQEPLPAMKADLEDPYQDLQLVRTVRRKTAQSGNSSRSAVAGRFQGLNETGGEGVVEDGDVSYGGVFRKEMGEFQFQDLAG